jgi:hypothetical protein
VHGAVNSVFFDKMVAESDGKDRYENCFARWKWRINEFVLTNKAKSIQNLLLLIKKRAR